MKICLYISTLLYQHDCVIVPGMGGFIANNIPSTIVRFRNNFLPPSKEVLFNANLQHNDGLLGTYISVVEDITYAQALIRIEEEIQLMQAELKSGKTLILGEAGTLRLDEENNIRFTPDQKQNFLEESFGLATFSSPVIKRKQKPILEPVLESIQLPASIGRVAAMLVPLFAIGLWVFFNWNLPSDEGSNLSSILPSFHLTLPIEHHTVQQTLIQDSNPALIDATLGININPTPTRFTGVDPEIQMVLGISSVFKQPFAQTDLAPNESEPIGTRRGSIEIPGVNHLTIQHPSQYIIIEGAFSVKANAEKRIKELNEMDIDATLAGRNNHGLYLVSTALCSNNPSAIEKLRELKAKGIQSAWILKK